MKHLLMLAATALVGFASAQAEARVSDEACVQNGVEAAAQEGYTGLELVTLEKITNGRNAVHGYRIWFRRDGHRGYVVANADSFCNVFDVYKHW